MPLSKKVGGEFIFIFFHPSVTVLMNENIKKKQILENQLEQNLEYEVSFFI